MQKTSTELIASIEDKLKIVHDSYDKVLEINNTIAYLVSQSKLIDNRINKAIDDAKIMFSLLYKNEDSTGDNHDGKEEYKKFLISCRPKTNPENDIKN